MGRRKSIFGFILLLAILLTACTGNNSNGITAKKIIGLPADTPTHLSQKLGKHVNLDADVVIPKGVKEVPILKAGIYKIDPQKLRSTFKIAPFETMIDNKKTIEKVVVTRNADGSTQELAYDVLRDKSGAPMEFNDYKQRVGGYQHHENSRMIFYGENQTIYMTTEYNYIYYAFQRDTTSGSFDTDMYTEKSLPFMKPDDAFSSVVKTMDTLGLDVSGCHDTYCLDSLTSLMNLGLNSRGEHINYVSSVFQYLDQKYDWGEYDDYYYFVLYPKYHGIPIAEGDGSSIEGGTLDIAYCERGIEYLMANSLYKETGVLQSDIPVYGLDGALQMLKYKYDNTILTEPVTVSSIRFCYVPQPLAKGSKDYELTPAWQFVVKKAVLDVEGNLEASNFAGEKAQTDTIDIYFDATTGKEIIGSTPRL